MSTLNADIVISSKKGNVQGYRLGILKKWGKNTDLILESQKGKKKLHRWELEALNEIYLKKDLTIEKKKKDYKTFLKYFLLYCII